MVFRKRLIYRMGAISGAWVCKKMPKKESEKFAGYEKVTTFATALDEKPAGLSPERGSEKNFQKKSCQKIWWLKKKVLPLHHFPL